MLLPNKPQYLQHETESTELNPDIINNLQSIKDIANDSQCTDKYNIRRLSTICALMSMLRANNGDVDTANGISFD